MSGVVVVPNGELRVPWFEGQSLEEEAGIGREGGEIWGGGEGRGGEGRGGEGEEREVHVGCEGKKGGRGRGGG